jgi:hypothetical protein
MLEFVHRVVLREDRWKWIHSNALLLLVTAMPVGSVSLLGDATLDPMFLLQVVLIRFWLMGI